MSTSRAALEQLREQLQGRLPGEDRATASRELLAVAALLGRETALRATLSDPSADADAKAGLVDALLGGRLGPVALDTTRAAARSRWSRAADLPDALEALGAEAAFAEAESAGTLDRVEEELFRFSRLVVGEAQLRRTLSGGTLPVEGRVALVRDLLGSRSTPTTTALLEHVVGSLRGRRIEEALDTLVELAAARRSEVVAEATVAAPLTAEQEARLTAVLARIYGRAVRLQVEVDPSVLGGVVVRVGDEVVDGTVLHRLDQARRAFTR
nr:F0F1 ATP synthase subunit delta [Motilibacter aurantiacus]